MTTVWTRVRQVLQAIEASPRFEQISLLAVLGNCVTLALYDPGDRRCRTQRCQNLETCETIFTVFFLLEFLTRITAVGTRAYFRVGWNRLDFVIVMLGLVDFIPGIDSGPLTVLRTMRVLRPLRVVNRFPRLRILTRLLMDIIPMLGNVSLLCLFLFISMGIIGVQLWKGILRNGCYDEVGQLYAPPASDSAEYYLCSFESTGQACPVGINTSQYHCRRADPNFYDGYVSFDNIGKAFLTIFQIITLEEWSSIMYAVQDASSFWVWPYFVVLIVVGPWFAVNLALVVIATQFKMTKKRELELQAAMTSPSVHPWESFVIWMVWVLSCGKVVVEPRKRVPPPRHHGPHTSAADTELEMIREVFDLFDSNHDGTVSTDELKTALHALDTQLSPEELQTLCELIDRDGNGSIDFDEFKELMSGNILEGGTDFGGLAFDVSEHGPEVIVDSSAGTDTVDDTDVIKKEYLPLATRARTVAKSIVEHELFSVAVIVCIVINTGAMAAQHRGQSDKSIAVAEAINDAMAVCFAIEIILRVVSDGAVKYFLNGYNAIDAGLVLLGLVEIFFKSGSIGVLRAFRLLRLFKLARYMKTMRTQIAIMLRTLDSVLIFVMLLSLFVFIFAILGMHLFGGLFVSLREYSEEAGREVVPRHTFDNFLRSLVTVFQILTTEGWNFVMYDAMATTTEWAAVYFVVLLLFGTFILLNLFIAIMVDGFASDPEALARFKRVILRTRALIQKISSDVLHHAFPISQIDTGARRKGTVAQTNRQNKWSRIPFPWWNRGSKSKRKVAPAPESGLTSNTAPATTADVELPDNDGTCEGTNPGQHRYSELFDAFPDCPVARKRPTPPPKGSVLREVSAQKRVDNLLEMYPLPFGATAGAPLTFLSKASLTSKRVVTTTWFKNAMLGLVIINAAFLTLERPSLQPHDTEWQVLRVAEIVFAVLWTIEFCMKVCAFGLLRSRRAYLRSGWNRLDFVILVASWVSVALTQIDSDASGALVGAKITRIVITTRPLRVIQRMPSVKRTMHTLYMSIKPISNLLLMGLVFYIIFAIWGLQLFSGKLMYCASGRVPVSTVNMCNHVLGVWNPFNSSCSVAYLNIRNSVDCAVAGATWRNRIYNFDDLLQAMLTLFVVSSLDGWVDIMYYCVDAVGEGQHPQRDHSWIAVVYFILFLLIVGYFVVSMFVGVIVENFQLSMANFATHDMVTDADGHSLDTRASTLSKMSKIEDADSEFAQLSPPSGTFRRACYSVAAHKHFESIMTLTTLLNVTLMCTEHYNQAGWFTTTQFILNVIFTLMYTAEALLKIGSSSVRIYLSDRWNRVDAIIVLTSIAGTIVDSLDAELPITPSAIRVLKILRIVRVVKLAKATPGLASLLLAVRASTRHVMNLGVLLCLLFFVSSSLGMELFGRIGCTAESPCKGISKHANFQDMGMAFLTLFRIATGDNWSGIMLDTMREPPECDNSLRCTDNCCSSPGAVIFFVLFVVLAQFIMLNVVVAVLMKNLSDAVKVFDDDDDLNDIFDPKDESGGFNPNRWDGKFDPASEPYDAAKIVASTNSAGGHIGSGVASTPLPQLRCPDGEPQICAGSTQISQSGASSNGEASSMIKDTGHCETSLDADGAPNVVVQDGTLAAARLSEEETSLQLLAPLTPNVTRLLTKLQKRTQRVSEGPAPSTSGSSANIATNRMALKASLQLVLAMVHMMSSTEPPMRVSQMSSRSTDATKESRPSPRHSARSSFHPRKTPRLERLPNGVLGQAPCRAPSADV